MAARLSGLLMGAALASTAAAQTEMSVALDWFVNPNHGPLIVAQELGYFEEAGLEVELIAPADPADPPKMAAAGRVDVAVSYQPQLHLQIHEGLPLTRVGTLVATPLNCLLVLEDGGPETVAALKGGTIGYSVAGVEEVLLASVLARAGLSLSDVELVNVNFSLSPALMSGQVDAVIGAYRNFELPQMAIEGRPGRCFFLEEQGVPAYDELIFVADPERMDREAVAAFLGAVERGVQYMVNHPDEAWEIFAGTAPELRDELNRRAWTLSLPRFALRPAALDEGRWRAFEAWLKETGLIEGEPLPVDALAVDVTAAAD
ncbi:MAG TPA: ABC transporter substrate-binding protein [Paracoccaceae bacterium]|nr:ABC transporter substrate-binding protein [Paracoccaceae bacterium]